MFWQRLKNKWQKTSVRKKRHKKPIHKKDWNIDHAKLAYAEIKKNKIKIYNIRNFEYDNNEKITARYYDKTFDLNKLNKVYFIVSHFANFKGIAHTFLSFEFSDNKYISLSIEARRTKEQKEYSLVKGLFRQYEIIYVLGDENDILKLRTNTRKEKVHFYPVNAPPQKIREMFMAIIKRVNKIHLKSEFYNTINNNCTNNLINHVIEITNQKIPWSYEILLPGYSDNLAYKLAFIPFDKPFKKIKEKYLIDNEKLIASKEKNYSKAVRKMLKIE